MNADTVEHDFDALAREMEAGLGARERSLLSRVIDLRPKETGCRGFADPGGSVTAALREASALPDPLTRTLFSRALIARKAASALSIIKQRPITEEVVQRSRKWLPLLFEYLETGDHSDYWFPNDLFLKDYRFVTGLTVPCGAQVIDLVDGIGPKTALLTGLNTPSLFLRALRKPWFQIHTESRYLAEFNDPGWTAFYKTAVDLLEINPAIQGIVGTSWFYDPALAEFSPRLSYLRDYPLQHGAVSVRQGTTAFDIHSATATSETRRKLYQEGRYKPTCHTIVWPRERMIEWASRYCA